MGLAADEPIGIAGAVLQAIKVLAVTSATARAVNLKEVMKGS